MSNGIEDVRDRLRQPEDVDPGNVPPANDPPQDGAPPPDPPEKTPVERCLGLPLNDYGNGQRFVEHFGEDLMFVPRVGWFGWTGQVWAKDDDMLKVRSQAQQLAPLILAEIDHMWVPDADIELLRTELQTEERYFDLLAISLGDQTDAQKKEFAEVKRRRDLTEDAKKRRDTRENKLRTHAKNAGNSGPLTHMVEESQPRLAKSLDDLDADPLLVNCHSGAMQFRCDRSEGHSPVARVDLLPHARDQRLTKIVPAEFDARAEAPQFHAFLERIQPDATMRSFLQRWFGLSMTGLTGEQKLVFFYGSGANGKSVLVDLIARLMGDYSATAKIESLTGKNRRSGGDATPDLVPLIGARMVRASEPEGGERFQEAKIKELTGGEPILVRALNADFVEMLPEFKLTISGNHKPEVRGNDDGIWRRMLLVPFEEHIPEAERDRLLGRKLWEERAGILQWMVEGLIAYLEGGLREPAAVLDATAAYREESDPLGTFLTTACLVTGDASDTVKSAELTEAFNYWQRERGMEGWKGRTIQNQIGAMAKHWRHPSTGAKFKKGKSSVVVYEGIRITDMFAERFRNAPRDNAGRITGVAEDSRDTAASDGGYAGDYE